jgi:hypothetical protein
VRHHSLWHKKSPLQHYIRVGDTTAAHSHQCDNFGTQVAKSHTKPASSPSTPQVQKTGRIQVTLFFRRIFSGFRHRFGPGRATHHRLPLSTLKQNLQTLLDDCETTRARRVLYQIKSARTPIDLWDLRCEMHQCISHVHSQTEASRRINGVVTVFAGWVPANKLNAI